MQRLLLCSSHVHYPVIMCTVCQHEHKPTVYDIRGEHVSAEHALLQVCPDSRDAVDKGGHTALWYACHINQHLVALYLLLSVRTNASINAFHCCHNVLCCHSACGRLLKWRMLYKKHSVRRMRSSLGHSFHLQREVDRTSEYYTTATHLVSKQLVSNVCLILMSCAAVIDAATTVT